MRKFVSKIVLFTALLLVVHVIIYCMRPAGMMGGDYERFASPKAQSLILGTSMAAIDVDPEVINERLAGTYACPIYNFAYTINESPYGELYNKAALGKMEGNSKGNSLFILCVDPCNLGLTNADDEGEPTRENTEILSKIHRMYSISGFHSEYFFQRIFLSRSFYKKPGDKDIIYTPGGRRDTQRVWGRDGEDSSVVVQRWNDMNKPFYEGTLADYSFSESRLASLEELIKVLQEHGEVYLVNLPVGQEFREMLDMACLDFNDRMRSCAEENHIRYIDFSSRSYDFQTTDGVHLYGTEAARLTNEICDSICRK